MHYKVTALKAVTIRVFEQPRTEAVESEKKIPLTEEEWISLNEGEVREGLGNVLGVHPDSLPGVPVTNINGVSVVRLESWSDKDLPKEFLGLLRLEAESK